VKTFILQNTRKKQPTQLPYPRKINAGFLVSNALAQFSYDETVTVYKFLFLNSIPDLSLLLITVQKFVLQLEISRERSIF